MNRNIIEDALGLLDQFLIGKGKSATFIICGGAALLLQNIASRTTKDIDVIAPQIPSFMFEEIVSIAERLGIHTDWINLGPEDIKNDLKKGWEDEVNLVYDGIKLQLYSISREDLIFTKLWAMCDRQKDLADLMALKPTEAELLVVAERVKQCDANENWPQYVDECVSVVLKGLG